MASSSPNFTSSFVSDTNQFATNLRKKRAEILKQILTKYQSLGIEVTEDNIIIKNPENVAELKKAIMFLSSGSSQEGGLLGIGNTTKTPSYTLPTLYAKLKDNPTKQNIEELLPTYVCVQSIIKILTIAYVIAVYKTKIKELDNKTFKPSSSSTAPKPDDPLENLKNAFGITNTSGNPFIKIVDKSKKFVFNNWGEQAPKDIKPIISDLLNGTDSSKEDYVKTAKTDFDAMVQKLIAQKLDQSIATAIVKTMRKLQHDQAYIEYQENQMNELHKYIIDSFSLFASFSVDNLNLDTPAPATQSGGLQRSKKQLA